jgi:hypothetical protein
MFDFLNKKEQPTDVKAIRNELVLFIKEQLKKVESGEGSSIRGIQLFLAPPVEERHVYEAAVYYNEPSRFKKEEVQKVADDYAIDLPENWDMEITFQDELPEQCIKAENMPAGMHISTSLQATITNPTTAVIKILNGEAEQEEYHISANSGKLYMGRDKKVQTSGGFFRENNIAFPSDIQNDSNRFISRQHAHIEWSNTEGCFLLFADEGGIPPKNKTKIQTADGRMVKLQAVEIGHRLEPGDQIMLGESAVVLFNYSTEGA